VKKKDLESSGTFRVKNTSIAIYDSMSAAICTSPCRATRVLPPWTSSEPAICSPTSRSVLHITTP